MVALIFLSCIDTSWGHIIGEKFEATSYGQPSERTKIEERETPKKGLQDRRIYVVTFVLQGGSKSHLVVVSEATGRIVQITIPVDSVHHAVQSATYFCEGTVKMPEKAVWPDGLILENEPGEEYRGHTFNMSVHMGAGSEPKLTVACWDFMTEKTVPKQGE